MFLYRISVLQCFNLSLFWDIPFFLPIKKKFINSLKYNTNRATVESKHLLERWIKTKISRYDRQNSMLRSDLRAMNQLKVISSYIIHFSLGFVRPQNWSTIQTLGMSYHRMFVQRLTNVSDMQLRLRNKRLAVL